MGLSRVKHIIKSKIRKTGIKLEYGDYNDTFYGVLSKGGGDKPENADYILLVSHDSDVEDGEVIKNTINDKRFVPVKKESHEIKNDNTVFNKIYLKEVNASGTLKTYVEQTNASLDTWGVPSGTEGTDYGWVAKKNSVWCCFEGISLNDRAPLEIGALERSGYYLYLPFSINASQTPDSGDRFETTAGEKWKIESIDQYTFVNQAYMARVMKDDR